MIAMRLLLQFLQWEIVMQQEIESLITQTLGDNARFISLTFRGGT